VANRWLPESRPTRESFCRSQWGLDASGNVLYETAAGNVVTVNYAFDNATTLNKRNLCTVYGSFIAS